MALNLSTENLARSSASHPWRVVGIWVLVIVAAMFMVGSYLADGLTTKFEFVSNPEVKKGEVLLEEIRGPKGTNEVVVFESSTYKVDDAAYRAVVEELTRNLAALGPDIIRLETLGNYYSTGAPPLKSADESATLISFVMAGDFDQNSDNIEEVVEVVHEMAAREAADFDIKVAGQATIGLDQRELNQEDLEKGEAFGVPIALIILIVVLGAVAAAVVPLVMAIVSIILALGISAAIGTMWELSLFVSNIITMIGLAVGIDYSLFVVSRYREERGRGMDKIEAISRAGATASRAVVFSGMTVVLALIGMVLIPFNIFISIGLGAIFVVLAAMAAAMTLLPAILGIMGDKVNALNVPFIGKGQINFEPGRSGGFWDKLVRAVMAQPALSLLLTGGLLIAAIVPFFSINTGFAGISTFPDELESKQAFLVLDEKFSFGEVTPAEIVIEAPDVNAPAVQAGIERLKELLAADSAFSEPRELEVSTDGTIGLLAVPVEGDTSGEISIAAVTRLDEQYVEEAFTGSGATIYLSGETAFNMKFFSVSSDSAKIVFPFVLGISFLLLLVVFRSLILPIKAIILNLMAVGAAYGILVLVFQKGFMAGAFGFQESDTIESWIPLFLFSILFGLSMDYHVFLLSRIRERYDQTKDTTEAVVFGVRSTGRLITGAGLIMVAVFWGFATGSLVGMQQMGFGLGLAILLDASIVRIMMVPAAMKLLGEWNWYLPSWLEWMPDFRVEAFEPDAMPATADD